MVVEVQVEEVEVPNATQQQVLHLVLEVTEAVGSSCSTRSTIEDS
jgi:hypothetical protein